MHPDTPAGDAVAARLLAAYKADARRYHRTHPRPHRAARPVAHSARYLRVRSVVRAVVWGYAGAAGMWLALWAVAVLAGAFG